MLQQSPRGFCRMIGYALRLAAAEAAGPVDVLVEHMDDLSPEALSDRILQLGGKVQAMLVVAAEHPRMSSSTEALAARGVWTCWPISELTARCRTG